MPASFVTVGRVALVPTCLMETLAFAITAPELSVTVPVKVPRLVCPQVSEAAKANRGDRNARARNLWDNFMCALLKDMKSVPKSKKHVSWGCDGISTTSKCAS